MSTDDKQRLQQHFDSIRDIEMTMGNDGDGVHARTGLSTRRQLDALKSGIAFKTNGMIEDVVKLHLELVALAFACNYNRVGGAAVGRRHRRNEVQRPRRTRASAAGRFTTSATGSIGRRRHRAATRPPRQAHAEIDVLRMQTLAHGLDAFKARGLQDKSPWSCGPIHIADGPSHSMKNVPHIIWGNGGGFLKTGQFIDAGNVTNNKLLNTIITAAIRDKSTATVDFGKGTGNGMITAMLA